MGLSGWSPLILPLCCPVAKSRRQRQVVSTVACLVLLALLVAIFLRPSEIANPDQPRLPRYPVEARTAPPPKRELLASGVERALVQELPLVGRVSGARWISNHRFRLVDEEKAREYENFATAPPPMDVLVDAEDNFLMARLNGERFVTRWHEESIKRLLLNLFWGRKEGSSAPDNARGVNSVKPLKIAWADPDLGQSILGKFYRGLFERAYVR